MTARYTISEEDYVQAMRLHARLTPLRVVGTVACLLIIAVIAVMAPASVQPVFWGAFIGTVLMIVLGRWVLIPWQARRAYRKYKAIHDEFSLGFVPEGMQVASVDASGLVPWEKMLKWREGEAFILIYMMPRLFHIVPKSVASQGLDVAGFRAALQDRLGPAK
ncbi:YcxB family protein [Hydrogenophaga sp. 5NK40-0174]|uniref:YcxB family protein n=1 Tax=Hydrogenophaga sp. 5NK40-0174 TaxID=3127649 RepID=UPI003108F7EC